MCACVRCVFVYVCDVRVVRVCICTVYVCRICVCVSTRRVCQCQRVCVCMCARARAHDWSVSNSAYCDQSHKSAYCQVPVAVLERCVDENMARQVAAGKWVKRYTVAWMSCLRLRTAAEQDRRSNAFSSLNPSRTLLNGSCDCVRLLYTSVSPPCMCACLTSSPLKELAFWTRVLSKKAGFSPTC